MYVRISRIQAPPERLDDMVKHFKEEALPAVQRISGYEGATLGINRSTGDGQAATFWASQEALQASEEAANGIRTRTVQSGGGDVVSVQRLEVALLERTGPPSTPAAIRVIRAQVDPSKLDALVASVREKALPALRGLAGFRALNVAVDRKTGATATIAVYDTPANREAADATMASLRSSIFESAGASGLEIALYDILIAEFVHAAVSG